MRFIITIDGPAGAGKSSVARQVARRLGIRYLDTGAIYRAIAYSMDKEGISAADEERLSHHLSLLHIRLGTDGLFVNDENVASEIRTHRIDSIVSGYAALKIVREALLDLQRKQAEYGPLVVEGRDAGSVVFPDADMKFYLTASPEARAERRYKELLRRGEAVIYKDVLAQMQERDKIDTEREVAPLRAPDGALHLDTSLMVEEEVVNELVFIIRNRMGEF